MTAHFIQRRLPRENRAFTLVELLVVITIITILASTALFTMFGVREDVREKRAHALVAKINELIMEKWESYRTRAIPVRIPANTDPRDGSRPRLNALRELMRMELPDRKSDLLFPVTDFPTIPADKPDFLVSRPSLWQAYIRRARQQIIARYGLPLTAVDAWKDDTRWTMTHQNAECLYLILAAIHENDTTGLEFFTENEIGDADSDGMPEILDPWGSPIRFLRWAPGFRSDIQKGDLVTWRAGRGDAGLGNGDSFDPLKVDPRWSDTVPRQRSVSVVSVDLFSGA